MNYTDYLIAIACNRPTTEPDIHPIKDPAHFFETLFLHIARSNIPITREGTDTMMDILFNHKDMQPLLESKMVFQTEFAAIHLPTLSAAYQSVWTHIVIPAWTHHQELQQTLKNTAQPTNPESYCTTSGF